MADTANKLATALLKQQYSEWATTFKPIEQKLLKQISWNNPSVLNTAVSEAASRASAESSMAKGMMNRQNRALGIVPNAEQRETSSRVLNLQKALGTASAKNQARETQRELDEQVLLGVSSGNYGSLISGQNQ